MGKKKKTKKPKKKGKVQSKRKSKLETTKHSLGIIYYIIMIIFAVSLFVTLTLVWIKLWPLVEIAEEYTNSTAPSPITITIFSDFLKIIEVFN